MNKLWVKLTLAFGAVVAAGLIVVAVMVNRQISAGFIRFYAHSQMVNSTLPADLADYYGRYRSWEGVEILLGGGGQGHGMGMRRGQGGIILADANGRVVAGQTGSTPAQLSGAEMTNALPIQSPEGDTVGYLLNRSSQSGQVMLTASAQAFLELINKALAQAGLVAGGIGLLLGIIIARGVAAPLGRLAAAARRISQGELHQHVSPAGTQEIAEVARAFNEMSAGLAQAETLRRNMVADVAHELRTPLSVLQGNLRAILDDVYPLEKAEIARLYDQTRLLSRLVSDLRELAQADAGQLALVLAPTDLSGLLNDTLTTFQPAAEAATVRLNAQIPAALPPVQADSARLGQVLHNLLGNALKHTPAGGQITLSAGSTAQTVWLAVQDTGEGITAEDLPHLFDRFYRADKARSRGSAGDGSGLGLAIVRAIVEAHSGQVSVVSQPGQGSTFTIRLPRAQPA